MVHGFPCHLRTFPAAFPQTFQPGFMLPRALCVLSGAIPLRRPPAVLPPPRPLRVRNDRSASSFQGFWLPLRDVSRRRPLLGRSSHAPTSTVRPRRFSRPRRFAPPPAFAGLFHPAATSRVSLQGVVPHRGAAPGFPGLLPSSRLDLRACGLTRASTQGPGFRAFDSPRWVRWRPTPVKVPAAPRPSWAFPPPGFSRSRCRRWRARSVHTVHRDEPAAARS